MTCPYCEIHKLSAAMWRNKAYELGGTPLPWDADKKIEEAIAAEREAILKIIPETAMLDPKWIRAQIRARSAK